MPTDLSGRAKVEIFMLRHGGDRLREVWQLHRDEILPEFIRKNLCSRPFCWWKFDIKELRERIGGIGDLMREIEFYEPTDCHNGIPMGWVAKWQVEYYNGNFRDIHGNLVDSGFKEGDFTEVAIDPNDPPTYESEAAYLRRHDLLSEIEERYLKQHSELLKPEKVEFEYEED
jgi:hypothetical protein